LHEKWTASPVGLTGPVAIASSPEERSRLLPVEPAKNFLESRIGLDLLDFVEHVAQFVMCPRFVNKTLTRMTRRSDVAPAFAARHNVVPVWFRRS
jgi:hypothetical protein